MAFCHNPSNLDHWIAQLQGICGDQQLPRVLCGWCIAQYFPFFLNSDCWLMMSKKQLPFWGMRVNRKWTFCTLERWFWTNFGANRLYKRKDYSQYKFGSDKAYYERISSVPVDVRRSKTSLLRSPLGAKKVAIVCLPGVLHGWLRWPGISNISPHLPWSVNYCTYVTTLQYTCCTQTDNHFTAIAY